MEYVFIVDIRKDKRLEYLSERLKEAGCAVGEYESVCPVLGARPVYIFPPSVKLSDDEAESLKDGSKVFAFVQSPQALELFERKNITYINIYAEEKFAYRNALITAEGALMLVGQNTERVFSDISILVVGFGRVGKALIKIFKAVSANADVLTFDRKECASALLYADNQYGGFDKVRFSKYDVIINTVPARLINKNIIAGLKGGALILELASDPGGFDPDDLERREDIKLVRALGLPAKIAPVSAAKILFESIFENLDLPAMG